MFFLIYTNYVVCYGTNHLPFAKFLQKKDIDLLDAINYTQGIISQIQIIRDDESF